MPPEPIRVLLADDEPEYRATVRTLLEVTAGIEVVAEAGTGRAACDLAARHRLDVAVLDVRMPDLDGIAATRRITVLPEAPRVLVLTTFDLDAAVYETLRAGASGFLLKDVPPPRLVDGIRTVAAGEALLAPAVTRRLIADFLRAPTRSLDGVTAREREVLTLITRGLSNAEIEEALHLSRHTVKTHIGHLRAKLSTRDRAQLVIAGYEAGLADDRPAP
ncbi:DNA-binding response regulator, LuxR family [Actinokineospora spheciospongiae]|uniref:DNA-binding response regulator, LuxR family n=1 Tax=Actinokineospora spheciospongiae TaxID=909613 RepID=W7J2Q7_9PSEU|nr:response regulator transcription factor [Actinokineospora spheciospongiae]EWC63352.1 DNA-binding response regulator, LuxR family [Actinokineospora spheciospongiae]